MQYILLYLSQNIALGFLQFFNSSMLLLEMLPSKENNYQINGQFLF